MRRPQFVTITARMTQEYKLSGTKLLLFAVIAALNKMGKSLVDTQIDKNAIAHLIGSTVDYVSRALKNLIDQGIITMTSGEYRAVDPDGGRNIRIPYWILRLSALSPASRIIYAVIYARRSKVTEDKTDRGWYTYPQATLGQLAGLSITEREYGVKECRQAQRILDNLCNLGLIVRRETKIMSTIHRTKRMPRKELRQAMIGRHGYGWYYVDYAETITIVNRVWSKARDAALNKPSGADRQYIRTRTSAT